MSTDSERADAVLTRMLSSRPKPHNGAASKAGDKSGKSRRVDQKADFPEHR